MPLARNLAAAPRPPDGGPRADSPAVQALVQALDRIQRNAWMDADRRRGDSDRALAGHLSEAVAKFYAVTGALPVSPSTSSSWLTAVRSGVTNSRWTRPIPSWTFSRSTVT